MRFVIYVNDNTPKSLIYYKKCKPIFDFKSNQHPIFIQTFFPISKSKGFGTGDEGKGRRKLQLLATEENLFLPLLFQNGNVQREKNCMLSASLPLYAGDNGHWRKTRK